MSASQRRIFLISFIIYIYGLLFFLFVYQRNLDFSWWVYGGFSNLLERMDHRINLIPFRTIYRYVLTMNYATGMRNILVNIGGHMLLFSPLGFFLPRLREKFQDWRFFLFIVVVFVTFIEVLQLVSMSGSLDVDDIILNTIGAMLGFIFLRNPENIQEID